jgi:hypothetical protein
MKKHWLSLSLFLLITACTTTGEALEKGAVVGAVGFPADGYLDEEWDIDSVEEFSFEDYENLPPESTLQSRKGSAFRISVSSAYYSIEQLRYGGALSLQRSSSSESSIRGVLSRYDRVNAVRSAHLLLSINPQTGRLNHYRLVKSTYIRELDSLVMKDVGRYRFSVKKKNIPGVLYITYIVRLSKLR